MSGDDMSGIAELPFEIACKILAYPLEDEYFI